MLSESHAKGADSGILAYGSLIEDPGCEIEKVRSRTIENVTTPFPVEFARSRRTRGGAPMLVPHKDGACVRAQIFVVDTTVEDATNRLYRRERHRLCTGECYQPSANPNKVHIKRLELCEGIDVVLYTEIGANIPQLTAKKLAQLAIESVASANEGEDGISCLMNAMRWGIETPLTEPYEAEIKRQTGSAALAAALAKVKAGI